MHSFLTKNRGNFLVSTLIIVLIFFSLQANAAFSDDKKEKNTHHAEEKGFDPGEFIFDHIVDHYNWHILTTGSGKHISIHLPVIIYDKESGLHVFSSKKLDHGHVHDGFKIDKFGDYKGKVIKVDSEGHFVSRPLDFSFTKNVCAMVISLIIMLVMFINVAKTYTRRQELAPKGFQSLIEPLILFIRDDIGKASIGEKHYERFTPFLLTVFFFIFFNNLLGLIPIFPGGANVTGNITVTMGLALCTFIVTTISGNKGYWAHIFSPPGVPWWLKLPIPLIPFIELVGVFIKPFVLMIRLFANISAGHIVTLGFLSLIFIFGNISAVAGYAVSPITLVFTVFLALLELLVAFIQAYVFTVLSAIYFGMATEESH